MISIQSSLTELDRAHQLREGLLDCYLNAIRNCASYAVELDEEVTAAHRKYLRALAEERSRLANWRPVGPPEWLLFRYRPQAEVS